MSLLGDVLAAAGSELDTRGPKWVDDLVAEGRAKVSKLAEAMPPDVPRGVATEAAHAALDAVEEHKDVLVKAGRIGFAEVAARYVEEGADKAHLAWLRHTATFEERIRVQRSAANAAETTALARDAAWAETKGMFAEIGLILAKALVMLAVGAL